MIERTISQSMYNARMQELEYVKRNIYRENLDDLTIRKMRHEMQKKEWTKEDEAAYKAAYKKCADLIAIEEAKPLFNPDEKLVVVTDSEYEKLLALEEEKKAKLEEELNGTDSNTADTADTADTAEPTEENIER